VPLAKPQAAMLAPPIFAKNLQGINISLPVADESCRLSR